MNRTISREVTNFHREFEVLPAAPMLGLELRSLPQLCYSNEVIKLLSKDHQLWRVSGPSGSGAAGSQRRRKSHPWRRVFALVGALLLVIVIPSVLVVYFHPGKAQAAWFDNNWGFRQRIDTTVTSSASDISNLETLITVNTSALISASKLQSSCQDLRFTNVNGKVLNYYIDSGCNTTTTKIWVMADLVPKNTTTYTLYMYYGNTLAAAGSNAHYFDNVVGLVGYWTMNDGGSSATAADSSVGGNTGTLNIGAGGTQTTNTQAWTNGVTGQYSGSINLDGTDDYVQTSYTLPTTNFSYSFWAKSSASGSNNRPIGNADFAGGLNGTSVIWGFSGSSQIYVAFRQGANNSTRDITSVTPPTSISSGWHFVTVTLSSVAGAKLYWDGALIGSNSGTTSITSSLNLRIGRDGNQSVGGFVGQVDDVKVYNTARTAQQIAADYANTSCGGLTCTIATSAVGTSGPSTSFASEEVGAGPLLWWKFDDGTGTSAKDKSTNSNTGTLGGTTIPTWQTEDLCVSGKCLFFDGASSKVTGSKVANAVQSVAFWIRPNTIATQGLLNLDGGTHKISTNGSGVISATGFTSPTYYVNGYATTTPTLVQNQWNYVEITTGTAFNTTSSFTVGTDGTNFIKGFIDEVRFYNYARSASQAQADYLVGQASIGGSSATSANQQKFLNDGLVGYWKMDEASWNGTSGEVKDSSGNGSNGTASGATDVATITAGKFGNGGNFDGTDDYLTMAEPTSLIVGTKNFSISTWFKTSTTSTRMFIVSKYNASTVGGWELEVQSNGTLLFLLTGETTSPATSGTYNDGNWHHVVGVRSSTQIQLYVDGKLQASGASINSNLASGSNFEVGAIQNSGSATFHGTVDETRTYNRALSAQEVSQLYNFAPSPVGWWKMDERTGTSAFDSSGNGNTGTLTCTGGGCVNPTWNPGKYGSALTFNGSNNYVNLSNSTSLSPGAGNFTVSAWVKPSLVNGANHYIYVDYGGNTNNVVDLILFTTNRFAFSIRDGSGNIAVVIGGSAVTANTWYYVTGERSGTTVNLYVNGILDGTGTNSSLGTVTTGDGGVPTIGRYWDGSVAQQYWSGPIDDIRVYNYARTQSQIQEDMQGSTNAITNSGGSTNTSQPAAPLGYWKFDEGFGTTANNDGSGGSALNGTLTNMASPATSTSGWQIGPSNCKLSNCLAFNGTNNYVNVPNNSALNFTGTQDFSLTAWVKRATTNHLEIYFSKVSSTTGYELDTTAGTNLRFWYNNSFFLTGTGALADTNWHHIAVTMQRGGNAYMYVDGKQVATAATPATDSTTTAALTMGYNGASNFSDGLMDEPKIFNYALTADQVRTDYNLGSAVNYSGGTNEAANQPSGAGNAPVADWEFEERTGTTVNDTSGNANTGTWNGTGSPHWNLGKVGTSGQFSSVSAAHDYVSVPDASALDITGDMTVEAWVKPSVIDSTNRIFLEKGDGSVAANRQYGLRLNNSNQWAFFQYAGSTTNSTTDSTTVPSTSRWDHVVGVKSGTNLFIYTNGVLQHTTTGVSATNTSANILAIGRAGAASSNYFAGNVDSVKIFNYARSADQIAYDYNRGAPIARWKMDECQGSVINDSSGNGNTGTITIGASGTQTAVGTCNTSGTAWGNGATGKYNASLNFDGTDDFVDISTSGTNYAPTDKPFTVSAWFKTTSSPSTYGRIVNLKSNSSPFNLFYSTDITYNFAFGGSSTWGALWKMKLPSANVWHHVVISYNGNGVTTAANFIAAVDGVPQTLTAGPTIASVSNTSQIGAYSGSAANEHFTGQIDDVRIYNYALTTAQIQLLYNNGGDVFYGPATGNPSN